MSYQIQTIDALAYKKLFIRLPESHKGKNGSLLCIGGSPGMAGAILLAAKAALFSGAGLINVLMLDSNSAHVDVSLPEIIIRAPHHLVAEQIQQISPNTIILGPGLEPNELNYKMMLQTLLIDLPIVIDAGALSLLAQYDDLMEVLKKRKSRTVLTPHPGEAAKLLKKLTQDVQKNRELSCLELVKRTRAIIVLKGQETLVAEDDKTIFRCREGNSGMSSAGMGDILTGTIGALIAQAKNYKINLFNACLLGVQIHSLSADRLVEKGIGPIGLTATEVVNEIRKLLN